MSTEDDDLPGRSRGRQDDEVDTPGDGESSSDEEHVEPRSGASPSEHLAEIEHLRLELEKERGKAAELRDALMRTAADFDNFRKRLERDRIDERKQAAAGVVKNLLPVLDAVGRALASAGKADDNPELAGFVEGIRMVETQLMDVLRQAGLERVPTEGTFDPVHHEALMQEPHETAEHMTILDVFEPGYRLGGRLLRPARVKVAHNPGRTSEAGEGGSEAEAEGEPGQD